METEKKNTSSKTQPSHSKNRKKMEKQTIESNRRQIMSGGGQKLRNTTFLTKQLNPVLQMSCTSVNISTSDAFANERNDNTEAFVARPVPKQVVSREVRPPAISSVDFSMKCAAPSPHGESAKVCSNESQNEGTYHYRDFSRVRPDDGECVLDAIAHMPSSGVVPAKNGTSTHDIKHQKLPVKLNAMLSDGSASNIIAWMPHGRSWRILKPKHFVKEVLPKYFDYCNYNSFIRLVNAWGFRRFSSGPDRHSYYHELFLRNLPHLHSRMRRVTGKDKKPPVDQDDEPDLYEMSRLNPLPEAEVVDAKKPALNTPTHDTAAVSSSAVAHLNSVPAHGSNPEFAPSALKIQSATTAADGRSTSTWQTSVSNNTTSSAYAMALAEQIRQQAQHQVSIASSDRGFTQSFAPHTWPYTQYPPVPQFNSIMNPQSMTAPVSTKSRACASSAERSEVSASQLCMQQILQQMDASRLRQMLQSSLVGQHHQPAAASKESSPVQCDSEYSMLTHGHGPKNERGESPIMYIPVYPSTLASLAKLTDGSSTSGSDK